MQQVQHVTQRASASINPKALSPQSIAQQIFNDLKSSGLNDKEILCVSSEILCNLTNDIKDRKAQEN